MRQFCKINFTKIRWLWSTIADTGSAVATSGDKCGVKSSILGPIVSLRGVKSTTVWEECAELTSVAGRESAGDETSRRWLGKRSEKLYCPVPESRDFIAALIIQNSSFPTRRARTIPGEILFSSGPSRDLPAKLHHRRCYLTVSNHFFFFYYLGANVVVDG